MHAQYYLDLLWFFLSDIFEPLIL